MNIRYVADISMQTGKANKQIPNTQRLERNPLPSLSFLRPYTNLNLDLNSSANKET